MCVSLMEAEVVRPIQCYGRTCETEEVQFSSWRDTSQGLWMEELKFYKVLVYRRAG